MKIINFELRFVMFYFLISFGIKNIVVERYGRVIVVKNVGFFDN